MTGVIWLAGSNPDPPGRVQYAPGGGDLLLAGALEVALIVNLGPDQVGDQQAGDGLKPGDGG